ncbi:EscU/YscU/HrcU family type III secretion system export apparatus switch protein [Effusibacillus lacus]|uniref:Flagellar biosynthesis protein FlhB n=1 Tax=Effusibacillus lacus TaxID=1348429 RepID=A0A292YQG4_9BACL|nr:EscU/YscU/HrcU family type III secretion system export apparatus switch protein [Effusibacillus lacus]TCS76056.1 flagellar biosynthesis protein [Effusibacillus lacus]GAX91426.1 flagellar biosynthesis protein FlhB [Effusibacillus lacus]
MTGKKSNKAAALSYNPAADQAPRVVASGQGEVGRRIIELARENGVPVYEDPALVETLLAFDVGKEIPPELYQAVAEILVFIQYLERKSDRQAEVQG